MRTFPGESVMGRLQVLSAVHVTLDPLAAPVSSTKDCAAALALFVALFQFVFATTPALSEAAIAVPLPTKLMLTARGVLDPLAVSDIVACALTLELTALVAVTVMFWAELTVAGAT
jgi:hypothetical protein